MDGSHVPALDHEHAHDMTSRRLFASARRIQIRSFVLIARWSFSFPFFFFFPSTFTFLFLSFLFFFSRLLTPHIAVLSVNSSLRPGHTYVCVSCLYRTDVRAGTFASVFFSFFFLFYFIFCFYCCLFFFFFSLTIYDESSFLYIPRSIHTYQSSRQYMNESFLSFVFTFRKKRINLFLQYLKQQRENDNGGIASKARVQVEIRSI